MNRKIFKRQVKYCPMDKAVNETKPLELTTKNVLLAFMGQYKPYATFPASPYLLGFCSCPLEAISQGSILDPLVFAYSTDTYWGLLSAQLFQALRKKVTSRMWSGAYIPAGKRNVNLKSTAKKSKQC